MSQSNDQLQQESGVPAEAVADTQAILREAFGIEFQYWMDDGGWRRLEAFHGYSFEGDAQDFCKGVEVPTLCQGVTAGEPLVTNIAEEQQAVVLPLELGQSLKVAAVGTVRGADVDGIRRLAATALRAIQTTRTAMEQKCQLDAYARQLSQSFEELWWMRALAGHIEYCDANSGITAIAAEVLPSLCDVLDAQSLVLMRPLDGACVASEIGEVPIRRSCAVGEATVEDDLCHRLIRQFGPEAVVQPLVRNDLDQHEAFTDAKSLRSCMLVPLTKNDRSYGWLLAVNKSSAEYHGDEGTLLREHRRSELEFGTIEAGLIDSAAVMLATHARNVELFRESESLFIGVIHALAGAIDAKDPYTCGHSDRVARIARRLAEELGLDAAECEQVYLAGLLHDIGKIGIADRILCKPGPLTDEEYAEIRKHPVIGFAILRHVQHLQHALPGVLHHHESFDGTGYPGKLKGAETPLLARIIAVADAYDAMVSDRPYRKAMPFERAEAIFRENAAVQWDGAVVDALFSALADIHAICSDPNGSRAEDLTTDNAGSAPLVDEVESYLEGHLGACLSVFSAPQTS